MGIMEVLFGGASQTQQPQTQVQQQPQQAAKPVDINNPSAVPSATNPAVPTTQAAQGDPNAAANVGASPLSEFDGLWDTKPTDSSSGSQPYIAFDPAAFGKAASAKLNFAQSITPEQLQAISQGGDAAVQAFAQAMNSVAQSVLVQSTSASHALIEKALSGAEGRFTGQLPNLVRSQQANELLSNHPMYQDKAARPIIAAVKSQLEKQNPNWSAAEVAQAAERYVASFAESAGYQKPAAQPKAKADGDVSDWGAFFEAP